MKRIKHMLGVTLLEIMLVLAIAAMVIVMSIRYYQSATSSEQANAVLGQVTAIVSAADGLAQAAGSYASVTTGTIGAVVGSNNMVSPNGGAITFTGAASTFTISIANMPAAVCAQVNARLLANPHFSSGGACATSGTAGQSWIYTNQI